MSKAQIVIPDRSDVRVKRLFEVFDHLKERFNLDGYELKFFKRGSAGDTETVTVTNTTHGLCNHTNRTIYLDAALLSNWRSLIFVLTHECAHARYPDAGKLGYLPMELICNVFASVLSKDVLQRFPGVWGTF